MSRQIFNVNEFMVFKVGVKECAFLADEEGEIEIDYTVLSIVSGTCECLHILLITIGLNYSMLWRCEH